jgi:hypothetical protein
MWSVRSTRLETREARRARLVELPLAAQAFPGEPRRPGGGMESLRLHRDRAIEAPPRLVEARKLHVRAAEADPREPGGRCELDGALEEGDRLGVALLRDADAPAEVRRVSGSTARGRRHAP